MSTSIGISFEDEIREFLHRIGFSDVPRWGDDRTRLFLGEQEIDAFGRLGDLYIVVDAKASTSPSTSAAGTQRQLTYISGYKPRVEIVIQNEYRQHGYRYCVFIYWTKNKKLSQRHIDFARENNIAIRDETDLKYYRDALDLLENPEIVRNSFIKDVSLQIEEELFQIGPNIEVPAIQTRIGDKTFYTFQLQAETLLKLSYVFRLETNNLNILFSYQRLLKKEKIRSIREYLRNGGFFANNILVVSDEELEFRPIGSRSSNRYQSIGNIMLIDKPCYLEIIDGQHRLLAYSNLNELLDNCLCVTIISNLDRRDRARTFVTVNKEQTRVKSSLLWLLYQRTDPDSLEAQISIFVQNLNERGILKNFIIIPGVRSPLAYLSFTQICNALYNRTNLMQNYGSISSFYQVVNAFFTTIRNGNDTLTHDWCLSNDYKARRGFLCSNTGISIQFFLLSYILNARQQNNIPFPNSRQIQEWSDYLSEQVVPAITNYLTENIDPSRPNDPYGYLRGETSNRDRRAAANNIFARMTSYS